jgi:cytoskeletal protein RodZ
MNTIIAFFSNIKNMVITGVTLALGFLLWKNYDDRRDAENELEDIKDQVANESAKAEVQIKEAEQEAQELAHKSTVEVLEKRTEAVLEIDAQVNDIKSQLEKVKPNETITISV